MKEVSEDILRIIKEALKLEVNGQEFFNRAAELTHNELGKKMFRKLADDEVKHLATFSKLFSSVMGGENWKKHIKPEELKKESEVIEGLVARMKREESASELEGIRIGMELENKAIEFFNTSAQEVSDPAAKEILNQICDEERFHYDLLQAQLDSVTHDGFWLDSAEFRMDGKY